MAGIMSRIFTRRGLHKDIGPEAEEVKVLTDQFYITLRAISNKAEQNATNAAPAALTRVTEILNRDRSEWSWNDAYEAEQQLVHLFDDETITTELARRVLEARSVLQPSIADWYRDQLTRATSAKDQRALLLRLVNDLQWRYTVNEAKRGYSKQITSRTGRMFILVILLFVVVVLFFYGAEARLQSQIDLLILLAALAGTWGATFSVLTGLKKRMEEASFDDLKLARSWSLLLARVLIGMGAALVLYFFFRAGLLKGDMFPNISNIDSTVGGGLNKDSALLIVWCFLAGFSEKLVPGLLARTESQAPGDRPQITPQEPRPSGEHGGVRPGDSPGPKPATQEATGVKS